MRRETSPPGGESVSKLFGGTGGLCVAPLRGVAAFLTFQPPNLHSLCLEGLPLCLQPRDPPRFNLEESQGLGLSPEEDGSPQV